MENHPPFVLFKFKIGCLATSNNNYSTQLSCTVVTVGCLEAEREKSETKDSWSELQLPNTITYCTTSNVSEVRMFKVKLEDLRSHMVLWML